MALRMVEVVVPAKERDPLDLILQDTKTLDIWRNDIGDDCILTKVILHSENAEGFLDALEQRFKNVGNFRVVLLALEAMIPRPVEEAPAEESADAPNEKKSVQRIAREELYHDVVDGARISKVFILTVVLSTIVAAIAVLRDDVAVLIGAMVIAPLLGPNVSLSLATTLGDGDLAKKSLKTNGVGVAIALSLAILIGLIVPVDATVGAIQGRTVVGIDDIGLALAAGVAGALAFTQGVPATLVGVMVAVALLPPVVVIGLLLATGDFQGAYGAFLLVSVNVICVNLAGVGTFLAQGIAPTNWWEARSAQKATRIAITFWSLLLTILAIAITLGTD